MISKTEQTKTSELIRSEENDRDVIDNEHRNKWRRVNFSSDDLEALSVRNEVNSDIKQKYDTVMWLAHELNQMLFK